MIAALYVQTGGSYYGLPGVEPGKIGINREPNYSPFLPARNARAKWRSGEAARAALAVARGVVIRALREQGQGVEA